MILLKTSTEILLPLASLSKSLVEEMEATLASAAITVMAVDISFAVMGCPRRLATLATESLAWGGADMGRLVGDGNGGAAGLDFEQSEPQLATDKAVASPSVSCNRFVDFFFCLGCLSWARVLRATWVAFMVGKKGRREN